MTRARMAVAATVALGLTHLLVVAASLDAPDRVRLAHDVGGWAAALFGAAGTLVAARTFARGDYLRRVWTLFAAAAALLLVGHAIRSYWWNVMPGRNPTESALIYLRLVVIAAANLSSVWGLWLLAYSYRQSGLTVARSTAFNLVWAAVSALAVGLLFRQLRLDLDQFSSARQTASALTNIASTLGDTATIILIAPVLRVAYLMRGGRLAGVWLAMGLSGAVWLVYDYRSWIVRGLPLDPAHAMALLHVLRNPGLALMGLGGLLQREAVSDEPDAGAASPPTRAAA